jgi:hypothetical protein
MSGLSIQERYFADTVCFGCGPKNDKGRPTRSDAPLELHARVVELTDTEALTEARLESTGKLRATCTARLRRFVPR